MIDNTISWVLLGRYITNEATPDERRTVDNWLAASEANRLTFQRVQQRYTSQASQTPLPEEESDASAVWDRYIAPHLSDADNVRPMPVYQPVWWQRTSLLRVAGLVFLIGLMAVLYRSASLFKAEPALAVQQNPVGKRSLITLPDGSRVWLNADSRLEFPKKFDGPLREVRLVGEAFFDVTHNPEQPFVIRLATASIRVLGTSFNVRAYPGDPTVRTTVVTGRVAFVPNRDAARAAATPSTDTTFILPNHHVVQQVKTLTVAKAPVIAQKETAWKENRLVFDQTPMSEVARTLERWYGLHVVLDQPNLANCPLTATFEGQSIQEVMDLIGRTGQFQYTLTNNDLVIRGRPCP